MKHIFKLICMCCFTKFSLGQSITQLEHFFNNDPGFGKGTVVKATSNTGNVVQVLDISIENLPDGLNRLYIRAKDDKNNWGLYDYKMIYIAPVKAKTLVSAEYFFNTDPGFGNATSLALESNTGEVKNTFEIPISKLPSGLNRLYIRGKDDKGTWALYDYRMIYVSPAKTKTLTAAEYFFNNDPGFGNATAIPLNTNSGTINSTFEVAVSGLSTGINRLYIRSKNDKGTWGLYDYKLFYIAPETDRKVVAAEYFFKKDPGFGNATSLEFVPNNEEPGKYIFEIPTDSVDCGESSIYIRVQDSEGIWSLYDYSMALDIANEKSPTINSQNEYEVYIKNGKKSVTVSAESLGITANDDCGIESLTLNDQETITFDATGEYKVKVKAIDKGGKFTEVEIVIHVKEGTLNVNDVALSNQIQLYPNPVTTTLQIITDLTIQNASLHDLNGRVIYRSNIKNNTIDLSKLSSGVYLLKIWVGNTLLTKRVLKE